jgi:multiple sugar transport system substrate-binding protein
MPARNDMRADYFAGLDANFSQGVNWDVIVAGLGYPDNPSHETLMPGHLESLTLLEELEGEISGDPDLDIDARVVENQDGLFAIWSNS